jgi:hypothetical protein
MATVLRKKGGGLALVGAHQSRNAVQRALAMAAHHLLPGLDPAAG